MKIFIYIILIIALVCWQQDPAFAQRFRFEHYGLNEGLSQSIVHKIHQDKNGFIWVATEDGLNRFDGTRFKIFRRAPYPKGLPWGNIRDIAEDTTENLLWLATSARGVCIFNLHTEEISGISGEGMHTDPHVFYLCMTDKNVWVAEETGISVINKATKKYSKNFLLKKEIKKIVLAKENEVWAFSTDGYIYIIDELTLNIKKEFAPGEVFKAVPEVEVWNAASQNDGSIWICTRKGLYRSGTDYKALSNGLQKVTLRLHDGTDLTNNYAYSVFTDSKQNLWVGIDSVGMLFRSSNETEFALYEKNPANSYSISDNYFYQIFEDHNNTIWLATENGLDRILAKPAFFETIGQETDIKYDRLSRLLAIGTSNEKEIILGRLSTLAVYRTSDSSLTNVKNMTGIDPGRIYYIYPINDKIFWIGCKFGIRILEKKGDQFFLRNPDEYPELEKISKKRISAIMKVKQGIYMFGGIAGTGIIIWNQVTHTLTFYQHDDSDKSSLINNNITKITSSGDGEIWITTEGGLSKFNEDDNKFTNYDFHTGSSEDHVINDIYEDDQYIWMAFYQEGLVRWNKGNKAIKYFGIEQGLKNNAISHIRPDRDGNIWLSTNNGISLFLKDREQFINYSVLDGIQDNEFNRFCVSSTDTKIYFGGVSGFTIIDKGKIALRTISPAICITDANFLKANTYVPYDNLFENKIVLPHNENYVNISFAALDFSVNHRIQYAYTLEGYDRNWISADKLSVATYANLKPGNYHFKVRAVNPEYGQNSTVTVLPIRIMPAWFQTNLFRVALVFLSFGFIIFLLRFYYLSRLRKQKHEYEKRIAIQQERQRISTEIHDDIGAGLSGIRLLTELTRKKTETKDLQDEIDKIYGSISELSGKMREVIWSLNTENDNLENLLYYLQRQGNKLFENSSMQFSVSQPHYIPDIILGGDKRRHIYLAVLEALNNSLKHSTGKKVLLTINVDAFILDIKVADDGQGISMYDSTKGGYGLNNMQRHIQYVRGNLAIENHNGVSIHFQIPLT